MKGVLATLLLGLVVLCAAETFYLEKFDDGGTFPERMRVFLQC